MLSRLRLVLLAALLATALAGVPAKSASAFPVVGLNIAGVPNPGQLQTAQSLGAKTVRMFLLWSDGQPARGQINAGWLASYVSIVNQLSAAGISVDFVVVRAPAWETGSADPAHSPRNPSDFADFL